MDTCSSIQRNADTTPLIQARRKIRRWTGTFFFYYHSNEIVPGDLVERAGTISESEETNVRTKQEKLNGRIEGEGQGECNTTTCGGALTFPPSHTLRTAC